jgi:uncharacterized protein (TIGR02145 family)
MKYGFTICFLLTALTSFCQEFLTDCRDNKNYKVVEINGTFWMAQNLAFESSLSSPLSEEQRAKQPGLTGRYYHLDELDSVCPCDWKLPDAEDWIDYFNYLAVQQTDSLQIKLSVDKAHIAFMNYDHEINIFSESNPLGLIPNGRMEGDQYYLYEGLADYWVLDPPNFGNGERNQRTGLVHVIPEVFDGKTHIHLRTKGVTNIHSHKHHLDPKKEKKLRKFMVRCVSIKHKTKANKH